MKKFQLKFHLKYGGWTWPRRKNGTRKLRTQIKLLQQELAHLDSVLIHLIQTHLHTTSSEQSEESSQNTTAKTVDGEPPLTP